MPILMICPLSNQFKLKIGVWADAFNEKAMMPGLGYFL